MESLELMRLERIARNLITDRLRMEQVEGNHGTIYIAHGINAERTIVGVWGHRGIARDMEFKDDTSLDSVRQNLVNDAAEHIEMMVEKDLIDAGNGRAAQKTIQ